MREFKLSKMTAKTKKNTVGKKIAAVKRRSGKANTKATSKYATKENCVPISGAKYNPDDATHEVVDGKYRGFRVIVLSKTSTTKVKVVLLVNARGKPYSERSPKLVEFRHLQEDLVFFDAVECLAEDDIKDDIGDLLLADDDAKTTEEEYSMKSETKLGKSGFFFNSIHSIVHCTRRLSGRCDPKDGLVEWKDINFTTQVCAHGTNVFSPIFVVSSIYT